ncbi:hypothetical protein QTG56_25935 (plasmid) [Rossellomorea sp. AcN35-11]|nr:hypothetical protein [Rossellomorea aquimaris]WJV32058.1 hypothetical protein QTG56_25935 [Rossellomorea sp. AcN35-11]
MEWLPNLDISEEYDQFLNDIELRKVKQLQSSMRSYPEGADRNLIEKEIYQIYLYAIKRYKNGLSKHNGLEGWFSKEESHQFEELKEKVKSSKKSKDVYINEARVYELYLKSICRQTEFPIKGEVSKFIDMMKKCETSREAEILSTVIVDLLRTAK